MAYRSIYEFGYTFSGSVSLLLFLVIFERKIENILATHRTMSVAIIPTIEIRQHSVAHNVREYWLLA